VAAAVGRGGLYRQPLSGLVVVGNALAAVLLVASLASAATAWQSGPDWERRATLLLQRNDVSPYMLNDVAWMIATGSHPDRAALDAALRLAERAVDETGRSEPNLLDTLAEVHFQRGEPGAALGAIEEAMRIEPEEPYYRGQRERFLGRRDPDDRPDPPSRSRAPGRESGPNRRGDDRPLVPGEPEVGA